MGALTPGKMFKWCLCKIACSQRLFNHQTSTFLIDARPLDSQQQGHFEEGDAGAVARQREEGRLRRDRDCPRQKRLGLRLLLRWLTGRLVTGGDVYFLL